MNNITTLEKVWNRVNEQSQNCWDSLIPIEAVHFEDLETIRIGNDTHPLKPIAQREAAYRLGIPLQYLRKCSADLQAYNLNHWMEKERNEKLFFRFDGNAVRALFTPKYTPIDHKEILKKLELFGYDSETPVQCHLDDEFLLLNIPDGEKTFTLPGNDRMQPGISIANSEVGLSALSISAFVLRLICTNGLIAKTDVTNSYRHISHRILNEFPAVLNQITQDMDKQRRSWAISVESPVNNPEATLKSFNRQFQLKEAEQQAVEWAWPLEAGDTLFHIVNAYTHAAQYPALTAESEYRLQKVGGNILAMLN
jgi:hypothetical protein